jgi:hypothetical protein
MTRVNSGPPTTGPFWVWLTVAKSSCLARLIFFVALLPESASKGHDLELFFREHQNSACYVLAMFGSSLSETRGGEQGPSFHLD